MSMPRCFLGAREEQHRRGIVARDQPDDPVTIPLPEPPLRASEEGVRTPGQLRSYVPYMIAFADCGLTGRVVPRHTTPLPGAQARSGRRPPASMRGRHTLGVRLFPPWLHPYCKLRITNATPSRSRMVSCSLRCTGG